MTAYIILFVGSFLFSFSVAYINWSMTRKTFAEGCIYLERDRVLKKAEELGQLSSKSVKDFVLHVESGVVMLDIVTPGNLKAISRFPRQSVNLPQKLDENHEDVPEELLQEIEIASKKITDIIYVHTFYWSITGFAYTMGVLLSSRTDEKLSKQRKTYEAIPAFELVYNSYKPHARHKGSTSANNIAMCGR